MDKPILDLTYYQKIAEIHGIPKEVFQRELIDLIKETKSYIGAVQILTKKISKGDLKTILGAKNEKKSMVDVV
jgi:hypothetical protein